MAVKALSAYATVTVQALVATSVATSSYGSFAGSGAPSSGTSVEVKHDGATGTIISFDRSGSAYKAMVYGASSHRFSQGAVTVDNGLTVSANGITVVAGTSSFQSVSVGGSLSALGSAILNGSSGGMQHGIVGAAITSTVDAFVAWMQATAPLNTSGTNGSLLLAARNVAGAEVALAAENSVLGRLVKTSTAGETALFIQSVDTGAVSRVKTGASGTGPGGVGRALYI